MLCEGFISLRGWDDGKEKEEEMIEEGGVGVGIPSLILKKLLEILLAELVIFVVKKLK